MRKQLEELLNVSADEIGVNRSVSPLVWANAILQSGVQLGAV